MPTVGNVDTVFIARERAERYSIVGAAAWCCRVTELKDDIADRAPCSEVEAVSIDDKMMAISSVGRKVKQAGRRERNSNEGIAEGLHLEGSKFSAALTDVTGGRRRVVAERRVTGNRVVLIDDRLV